MPDILELLHRDNHHYTTRYEQNQGMVHVLEAEPTDQGTVLAAQQQESKQVQCSSDGLCMLQQPSGIPPALGMTLPEQPGQAPASESGLQIPYRQGINATASAN